MYFTMQPYECVVRTEQVHWKDDVESEVTTDGPSGRQNAERLRNLTSTSRDIAHNLI